MTVPSAGPARRRRARLTATAVAAGLLLTAWSPAPAGAHLNVSKYTRQDCGGGSSHLVDPINVVFYDKRSTAGQVAKDLHDRVGWDDDSGSSQSFFTHGSCYGMDRQRASNCGVCNRDHIRLFVNADADSRGNWYVIGDAHHDKVTTCGHVADTYDDARGVINEGWYGHFATHFAYWGNTASMKQCTGRHTASDGNVLYAGA
jgi:hypothetical protein